MRQDSDSELAGKLGASLTPSVARAHTPRGEQSSGLFDLQSLYAMHVERVQAMQAPPVVVVPVPRIAPPLPLQVRPRVAEIPIDVVMEEPAPARAIPRPIGWFAVFVTWLATVTLAGAATTQVPAHVSTRVHPMAAVAISTSTSTSTPSATATATATPTASPTPSSSVPEFVVSDLPRVQPSKPAPVRARAAVATAPPPAAPVAAQAPAPAPEPKPAPRPAVAEAPPVPAKAAAPAPAPAAASTGDSLEDLIRREVAAEQKKIRAAKGQ